MTFYNTIDLDKVDKQQLQNIIDKIKLNPCLESLNVKDSSSKGYHILLTCKKECDVCRIVFDDQKRLEMDSNRPLKYQNTLFTSKEWVRGDLKKLSSMCESCAKYGKQSILQKIELSGDEKCKKLEQGKIPKPYVILGHEVQKLKIAFMLGMDYYECPICHWFKFVNTAKAKI